MPVVRALTAADAVAARTLVHSTCGGSRHLARTLELLEQALNGNDPECAGTVRATDVGVDAMILHGPIAGASAVEKLHALVGSDVQAVATLVDALRRDSSWRMIVCELAEDSPHAIAAEILVRRGFTREGIVHAFFDEHTALALYVLRRDAGSS